MKKIMILTAGIAAFATAATAQISIAPEIGLNLANMHSTIKNLNGGKEKQPDGLKLGVKAGVNVNIPVGDHLVIQPGLFYSIKGTKSEVSDPPIAGITETDKNNITLHYADVAVNIQYNFNDPSEGRFFVGVGPFVGIALAGKNLRSTSFSGTGAPAGAEHDTSFHFGNDYPTNNLRRFDFGGQLNAGYLLRSGIFFRGMYQQGFFNLIPQGNQDAIAQAFEPKTNNTNITISVGYMFGNSPKSKGPRMKGSSAM